MINQFSSLRDRFEDQYIPVTESGCWLWVGYCSESGYGQTKAKDSNIRQAIMDRYGSTREAAIGTKKNPQELYGVSKDIWAALGVAITASETTST